MSDETTHGTPRPAKVTYDVGVLFTEIRDELRDLNVKLASKADAAELRIIADRVLLLEADIKARSSMGDALIREFRDAQRDVEELKQNSATEVAVEQVITDNARDRRAVRVAIGTAAVATASAVAQFVARLFE